MQLFGKLESASLRQELERRRERVTATTARDVGRVLADRVRASRDRAAEERRAALRSAAIEADALTRRWFASQEESLGKVFGTRGLSDVRIATRDSGPDDSRAHWYRTQIVESAKKASHFADLSPSADKWWSDLRIRIGSMELKFVASLHAVGRDARAMAITTFAEVASWGDDVDDGDDTARAQVATSTDAFTFVDEPGAEREDELSEFLEESLAIALAEFIDYVE